MVFDQQVASKLPDPNWLRASIHRDFQDNPPMVHIRAYCSLIFSNPIPFRTMSFIPFSNSTKAQGPASIGTPSSLSF